MIITAVVFVLILGLIVFFHEFGHFAIARAVGIKVEEFAFGFPPRLWSFLKRGTRYSVNLLPLGGYVRLLGEERPSSAANSFTAKPPLTRLAVIVAGVVMNLLVAWLLLTVWFAITIAKPPRNAVVVAQVLVGSAAEKAGLLPGDVLVAADTQKIESAQAFAQFTRGRAGQPVTLTLLRFGREVAKTIELGELPTPLGVAPVDLGKLPPEYRAVLAPVYALAEIWMTVAANSKFIVQALASLVGGPKVEGEVAGPVGIFAVLSQMVSLGPLYILRFAASLSLLVGFFNILPIPALDGGKAAFVFSELISRRRLVREQLEQTIHFVGLLVLLSLLVVVTYQDIVKMVTRRL